MSEVVGKLWGFCHTLRHDGIGYGDYIEQLTYLLFLKLAEEKGVKLPNRCSWSDLKRESGSDLLDAYIEILRTLGRQKEMLGDIFAGSLSKFREPVNLKKLIMLIDETQWTALDVDIKADAYEGLLQKYAEEEKGAGQYFTPREAIRCVVRCIRPDIKAKKDFTIHDPAVGTAGFLIGAYEWTMKQTKEGALLTRDERERLQNETFSGGEIVLDTRRLALMNLYLHEIEADIYYGDSLAEGPHTSRRYDIVMTNPPFGTKGAGQAPETAGKEIRKLLMEDCNLHTILRLPIGTFTPYSPGVKANIIFFTKGEPTKEVWIYDDRTNIEKVAIRNPLTSKYFEDFEKCYHSNPRRQSDRFKKFSRGEIAKNNDSLDIVWLREESVGESREELSEPEELIAEAITNVETAMDALNEVSLVLGNNKQGNNGE